MIATSFSGSSFNSGALKLTSVIFLISIFPKVPYLCPTFKALPGLSVATLALIIPLSSIILIFPLGKRSNSFLKRSAVNAFSFPSS